MARGRKPSATPASVEDKTTRVIVVEKKEFDASKILETISVKVQCKNESQKN